ncbi:hypothetical protein NUW58_g2032 [Xylaria curta]|uniref:Uncharacterized protein n=1 Tax=Xylaria curta TaxID=42375 RepID=A0ACC1PKS6_9PEZI|nr:hypothetical protein NUW58_g2032 [Xylaria curta]
MSNTDADRIKNIEAQVLALVAERRTDPYGFQETWSSLIRDYVDEVQIGLLSSQIDNGLRGLAEDMTTTVRDATLAHSNTQQAFEAQVERMKRNNSEFMSAVARLHVIHDTQELLGTDELKDMEKEIERLKVALAESQRHENKEVESISPAMETQLKSQEKEIEKLKHELTIIDTFKQEQLKYAEHWKKSISDAEEITREQESLLVAQKEEHQAEIMLHVARYRALVEELATIKGSIRVICRVRCEEAPAEDLVQFSNPDGIVPCTKLRATYESNGSTEHKDFEFQRAFTGGEDNQTIFSEVRDFAVSAISGNTCTVMAYGATGSGKSYTFLSEDGLVLNFINLLFNMANEELAYCEYDFQLSAVEIYLNKCFDLLQVPIDQKKAEVRLNAETTTKLNSQEEAVAILKQVIERREVAPTKQNSTSSRSHFVVSIRISKKALANPGDAPTKGVINFVDLGGSEAAGKNFLGGSSSTLITQQGVDINNSLLDLGKAIRNVAMHENIFPSHSLTKFLRSSFDSGSRLLVVATVSSLKANQNNTLSTLRWSQEAIGRPPAARAPMPSKSSSGRSSKLPLASPTSSRHRDSPSSKDSAARRGSPAQRDSKR